MRMLAAICVCVTLLPALAAESDHQRMLETLHITNLRAGADGWNKAAPNAANYDEKKVGTYTLPDPLRLNDGTPVTTPAMWWQQRRPQLVEIFDHDIYGRIPAHVPFVRWEVQSREEHKVGVYDADTEHLVGHVDNHADSAIAVDIKADLTLPAQHAGPVPVMIALVWNGKFPPMPQGDDPDWHEQLLAKGWGYVEYDPLTVQADNEAGLRQGIIGLVNKGGPRQPDDWGALRAWAWGASRIADQLQKNPRIDPVRIGVTGHSRYGKAALVAMAYDQRFAIGYISSSGAGGAKLWRRDYGERLENLTGEGEYHWMAGNFLVYGGPKTRNDLPVDQHELIALCTPRPVFISAGSEGDQWTDQRGMFLAAVAAGPVYRLLGKKDLGTQTMPPVNTALISGAIGFRQHAFGHTPQPNWATFLKFAQEQLK
jgi:hypothetical protein